MFVHMQPVFDFTMTMDLYKQKGAQIILLMTTYQSNKNDFGMW